MLKSILFLTLLVAAVSGSYDGCRSPSYFSAETDSIELVTRKVTHGRFFYDAYGERERIIYESRFNKTEKFRDVLVLWREKKVYIHDLKTNKCDVSNTRGYFRRIGVDDDYTYASSYVIGTVPGDGVEVGVWYKQENSTQVKGFAVSEFTRWHCLPFVEAFDGVLFGKKVNYRRTFVDVVTQVIDPNVFEIPKACTK